MREQTLKAISLIISSLILLYLLFINIYRQTFIASDWVVVGFDLFVKVIIEITLLVKKDYKAKITELELKKFIEWWSPPKKIKRHYSALRNWLDKAKETSKTFIPGQLEKLS